MTEGAVAVTGLTKVFPIPWQRRSIVAVRDLNLRRSGTGLRITRTKRLGKKYDPEDYSRARFADARGNRDLWTRQSLGVKACLLASLTLFVSTFATTNIFTVVVTVFVYFIGHLQATAREYWLQTNGGTWLARIFLAVVVLLFPDLQSFNLVDDIVAGAAIPLALFFKTAALGGFYALIYLLLAGVVFYGREL